MGGSSALAPQSGPSPTGMMPLAPQSGPTPSGMMPLAPQVTGMGTTGQNGSPFGGSAGAGPLNPTSPIMQNLSGLVPQQNTTTPSVPATGSPFPSVTPFGSQAPAPPSASQWDPSTGAAGMQQWLQQLLSGFGGGMPSQGNPMAGNSPLQPIVQALMGGGNA